MTKRFRVQKRDDVTLLRKIVNPIIFVIVAFVFCGIFLAIVGFNPMTVYGKMLQTFFSYDGLTRSIEAGLPLMFTGLAVAFGYRMNLNNIGADGQYALGAIFCVGFALYGPDMAPGLKLFCMFLMAMLGGAIAALIAAIPRALWNVSETILTMMLNYVFLYVLNYLMYGPWKQPGQMVAQTALTDEGLWLPDIGNSGINSALLIAIAVAVILYFVHTKTTRGFQMEVIRFSPRAADYAGMSVWKNILLVLAVSGAIAGLAGFAQVGGIIHRVQADLPNNAGYTGIVIAFLAYLNPLSTIVVGFLFGALQISAVAVQITGVPSQVAMMIQGSIMLFVIAGEFFIRYRIVRTSKLTAEIAGAPSSGIPLGGLPESEDIPDESLERMSTAEGASREKPAGIAPEDAPKERREGMSVAEDAPKESPEGMNIAEDAPKQRFEGLNVSEDRRKIYPEKVTDAENANPEDTGSAINREGDEEQ